MEALNTRIEAGLQARGLIAGGEAYHGRPVMVTTNDYETALFNGDIGLLWRDGETGLRAWFRTDGHTLRSVSVRQLPAYACAYALTVHKSQGSEFDEVMVVLPGADSPVLTRELIYTGITRPREAIVLHGDEQTFVKACRRRVQRTSALPGRLGWEEGDGLA